MTKKDGDKLRAMKDELRKMANAYNPHSQTSQDLQALARGITYSLTGRGVETSAKFLDVEL